MLNLSKTKFASIIIISLLGGLGVGFIVGHDLKPVVTKTVEVEKKVVIDHTKELMELQTQLKQLTEQVQKFQQKKDVVTIREKLIQPDGTVKETERTEDKTVTNVDTTTKTDTTQDTRLKLAIEQLNQSWETKYRLMESKLVIHDWAVGATVGYYLPSLWKGNPDFNISPARNLVGGLSVKRRLMGERLQLWGTAGLNTMGVGTLGLEVRW